MSTSFPDRNMSGKLRTEVSAGNFIAGYLIVAVYSFVVLFGMYIYLFGGLRFRLNLMLGFVNLASVSYPVGLHRGFLIA